MTEETGAGTLKCIAASSPRRALDKALDAALDGHIDARNVRRMPPGTVVVYTEADVATVREWIAPSLAQDESLFVVEFERWSSFGPEVDRAWLLRRGH